MLVTHFSVISLFFCSVSAPIYSSLDFFHDRFGNGFCLLSLPAVRNCALHLLSVCNKWFPIKFFSNECKVLDTFRKMASQNAQISDKSFFTFRIAFENIMLCFYQTRKIFLCIYDNFMHKSFKTYTFAVSSSLFFNKEGLIPLLSWWNLKTLKSSTKRIAMKLYIQNYLEISTIHGLSYISKRFHAVER